MSTIRIDVKGSFDKMPMRLRMFARDLPFAVANALNDTAFDAQKTIKGKTLPETFTLRNKRTQTGIRVNKARKESLTATVGTTDWWTAEQVSGAKRAGGNEGRESVKVNGKPYLAVPAVNGAPAQVITKGQRASALIAKSKAFVVLLKDGLYAVVADVPGQRQVQVLYFLKPMVTEKDRLPLEQTVSAEVRRVFDQHLEERLAAIARKAGAV